MSDVFGEERSFPLYRAMEECQASQTLLDDVMKHSRDFEKVPTSNTLSGIVLQCSKALGIERGDLRELLVCLDYTLAGFKDDTWPETDFWTIMCYVSVIVAVIYLVMLSYILFRRCKRS